MRYVNRNPCWDTNAISYYVLNILFGERLYLGDGGSSCPYIGCSRKWSMLLLLMPGAQHGCLSVMGPTFRRYWLQVTWILSKQELLNSQSNLSQFSPIFTTFFKPPFIIHFPIIQHLSCLQFLECVMNIYILWTLSYGSLKFFQMDYQCDYHLDDWSPGTH